MSGLHNKPEVQPKRRKLRRNLTPAEASLWKALQRSQLDGRKFRRQHSVGPFILDFYCVEERLAVELDGDVHWYPQVINYDRNRTEYLRRKGIRVIRFENCLVFKDLELVKSKIQEQFGRAAAPSTTPSAPTKNVGAATPPIQEGSPLTCNE